MGPLRAHSHHTVCIGWLLWTYGLNAWRHIETRSDAVLVLHYIHAVLIQRLKVLSVTSIMGNCIDVAAESMEIISLQIVHSIIVVIDVISTLGNFE